MPISTFNSRPNQSRVPGLRSRSRFEQISWIETQLSHTIWNLDTSFCGHKWICLPGPAPAGQANPQQQPAEQRIQWEGGENFFTFLPEERRQLSMDSLYFQGTCNIELVASGKRNNEEEEALKTSDLCKVHIAPIHDCIHMYTQSCILCIHIYIQYVYTDIHLFTFSNVTEEDMAFLPKVSLVFLSINVFRT